MPKETFHILFDIENAGSGYEGMGAAGTAGATAGGSKIVEGTIESESGKEKTFASLEPSSTEAPGLRGQVFKCLMTKVEAESAKAAMEWAAQVYGKKGTLCATPKEAKVLEFKKA